VDLFVRKGNRVAIGMYEQFGYSVYRRVVGYYHSSGPGNIHDDEDAYGTILPSLCSSLVNGRYEEAFKAGQAEGEYTTEWQGLRSLPG
jgi:hypothetical protein